MHEIRKLVIDRTLEEIVVQSILRLTIPVGRADYVEPGDVTETTGVSTELWRKYIFLE